MSDGGGVGRPIIDGCSGGIPLLNSERLDGDGGMACMCGCGGGGTLCE